MSCITWIGLLLALAQPVALVEDGPRAVAGRVTDERGEAIGGASVTLGRGLDGTSRTTLTDLAGNFRLRRVEPGEYVLRVELLGFDTQTLQVAVPGDRPELRLRVAD
jgi:hypothetical protein